MLSVFMLIFQFINSQNRIIIRPQRVNQFQELLTLFGEFHVRGFGHYLSDFIPIVFGDTDCKLVFTDVIHFTKVVGTTINVVDDTGSRPDYPFISRWNWK